MEILHYYDEIKSNGLKKKQETLEREAAARNARLARIAAASGEFMQLALEEAALALAEGEVPVGAVLVHNGEVIARAHNRREAGQCALLHAETEAVRQGCQHLGSWRLKDCDLYVTLEPCAMCSGSLLQSRIRTLVFGAKDPKAGCAGSVIDLFEPGLFNHNINVFAGIMEKECSDLLAQFFQALRSK